MSAGWYAYLSLCLVRDTAAAVANGTLDDGGKYAGFELGRLYRYAHELADVGTDVCDVREMLRCGLELGRLRVEARHAA